MTDSGIILTNLTLFGVLSGTTFAAYIRSLKQLVSTVTGDERPMAPSTDMVIHTIRDSVGNQFPMLFAALFPDNLAKSPRPYTTLDALWTAFLAFDTNKSPALNGDRFSPSPAA